MNFGRKGDHKRFDEDGRIMDAKPSKTLNKVKAFLTTTDKEGDKNESEEDKDTGLLTSEPTAIDISDDFYKLNNIEKVSWSDISSSSESESDIQIPLKSHQNKTVNKHDSCESPLLHKSVTNINNEDTMFDDYNADNDIEVFGVPTSENNKANVDLNIEQQSKDFPVEKRKRRKPKKKSRSKVPNELANDPEMRKYWAQRYRLFSRFDEGIKLDRGKIKQYYIDCDVSEVAQGIYYNIENYLTNSSDSIFHWYEKNI